MEGLIISTVFFICVHSTAACYVDFWFQASHSFLPKPPGPLLQLNTEKPNLQTLIGKEMVTCEIDPEPDVYWKTWRGSIPRDAIVGSFAENNYGLELPVYLAQVFPDRHDPAIIPAHMFKHSKTAKFSYKGKQHEYGDNIKILCAVDARIVTWVPIEDVDSLQPEEDCVISGTMQGEKVLFGRTKYKNETIIGSFLPSISVMFFPYRGVEKDIERDFQVLCYSKAVEAGRTSTSRGII